MAGKLTRILLPVLLVLAVLALLAVIFALLGRTGFQVPPPVVHRLDALRVTPQVAFGVQNAWLVAADGSLWYWGIENVQSVSGSLERLHVTPELFDTAKNWSLPATSVQDTLILRTNSTLWRTSPGVTWMASIRTTNNATSPREGWKNVSGTINHLLALHSDGSLWGLGHNNFGELGDTVSGQTQELMPIQTNHTWSAVAAGWWNSCGITTDGRLWAWGMMGIALPSGARITQPVPVQIGTDTNWVSVHSAENSVIVVKSDGSFWNYGWSHVQVNPAGPVTNSLALIAQGSDWLTIVETSGEFLGLKQDGTLWTIDSVAGPTGIPAIPRRFGTRSDWQGVWAGGLGTVAGLTADRTLWSWGVVLGAPEKRNPLITLDDLLGRHFGISIGLGMPLHTKSEPWPIMQFIPPATATPAGK